MHIMINLEPRLYDKNPPMKIQNIERNRPPKIDKSPEASGLFLLIGCSLSCFKSNISLMV